MCSLKVRIPPIIERWNSELAQEPPLVALPEIRHSAGVERALVSNHKWFLTKGLTMLFQFVTPITGNFDIISMLVFGIVFGLLFYFGLSGRLTKDAHSITDKDKSLGRIGALMGAIAGILLGMQITLAQIGKSVWFYGIMAAIAGMLFLNFFKKKDTTYGPSQKKEFPLGTALIIVLVAGLIWGVMNVSPKMNFGIGAPSGAFLGDFVSTFIWLFVLVWGFIVVIRGMQGASVATSIGPRAGSDIWDAGRTVARDFWAGGREGAKGLWGATKTVASDVWSGTLGRLLTWGRGGRDDPINQTQLAEETARRLQQLLAGQGTNVANARNQAAALGAEQQDISERARQMLQQSAAGVQTLNQAEQQEQVAATPADKKKAQKEKLKISDALVKEARSWVTKADNYRNKCYSSLESLENLQRALSQANKNFAEFQQEIANIASTVDNREKQIEAVPDEFFSPNDKSSLISTLTTAKDLLVVIQQGAMTTQDQYQQAIQSNQAALVADINSLKSLVSRLDKFIDQDLKTLEDFEKKKTTPNVFSRWKYYMDTIVNRWPEELKSQVDQKYVIGQLEGLSKILNDHAAFFAGEVTELGTLRKHLFAVQSKIQAAAKQKLAATKEAEKVQMQERVETTVSTAPDVIQQSALFVGAFAENLQKTFDMPLQQFFAHGSINDFIGKTEVEPAEAIKAAKSNLDRLADNALRLVRGLRADVERQRNMLTNLTATLPRLSRDDPVFLSLRMLSQLSDVCNDMQMNIANARAIAISPEFVNIMDSWYGAYNERQFVFKLQQVQKVLLDFARRAKPVAPSPTPEPRPEMVGARA